MGIKGIGNIKLHGKNVSVDRLGKMLYPGNRLSPEGDPSLPSVATFEGNSGKAGRRIKLDTGRTIHCKEPETSDWVKSNEQPKQGITATPHRHASKSKDPKRRGETETVVITKDDVGTLDFDAILAAGESNIQPLPPEETDAKNME